MSSAAIKQMSEQTSRRPRRFHADGAFGWYKVFGLALALNLLGFLTALGLRSVGISYERPTSIFAISLAWIFITSAGALFWIGPTTRSQSVWVAALWVGIISAPVES